MKYFLKRAVAFLVVLSLNFILIQEKPSARHDYYNDPSTSILINLGLVSENSSLIKKLPDGNVTRMEFVVLAAGMYNSTIATSGKRYFSDVEEGDEGFAQVSLLSDLGILKGNGAGTFMPEQTIKFDDALYIMLRIMGYQNLYGYDRDIASIEICRRYSLLPQSFINDKSSSAAHILDMVLQLMKAPVLSTENIVAGRDETYTKYKASDSSILNIYFDTYYTEGILSSNGMVNIYSREKPPQDILIVDGLKINYQPSLFSDFIEFIGYDVEVFYKDTDNPQYIGIVPSKNNYFQKLLSSEIDGLNKDGYVTANNKQIDVDFSSATVIYNHTLLESFDKAMIMPENGWVTLIDNNDDGVFDVVNIRDYLSFVVGGVYDYDDGIAVTAESKFSLSRFYISGKEPVVIKKSDGELVYLSDIAVGSIISVASVSKADGVYAYEIVLSEKKISGEITEIYSSDEEKSIMIDGAKYVLAAPLRSIDGYLSTTGQINAFIDFMGYVVDITYERQIADNAAIGYILEMGENKTSLNKPLQLRIYTELGRVMIFDLADKVMIDGSQIKGNSNLSAIIAPLGTALPQPVIFKLNKDNEINYIDFPSDYSPSLETSLNNHLVRISNDGNLNSGRGLMYRDRNFSGRTFVTQDALIMIVPDNPKDAEEKDFEIIPVSGLGNSVYYRFQAYSTDKNTGLSDVLVVRKSPKSVFNSSYAAVVTSLGTALNSEGEETYFVNLTGVNGDVHYVVKNKQLVQAAPKDIPNADETTYPVGVGDVIRYTLDGNGEISQMVIGCDYDNGMLTPAVAFNPTTYYSTVRTVALCPYEAFGDYLNMVDVSTSNFSNVSANAFEIHSLSKIGSIIEVKTGNKIYAKASDSNCIVTYTQNPVKHSKVVIFSTSGTDRIMFVYND